VKLWLAGRERGEEAAGDGESHGDATRRAARDTRGAGLLRFTRHGKISQISAAGTARTFTAGVAAKCWRL
jgi:hypothetical protein